MNPIEEIEYLDSINKTFGELKVDMEEALQYFDRAFIGAIPDVNCMSLPSKISDEERMGYYVEARKILKKWIGNESQ